MVSSTVDRPAPPDAARIAVWQANLADERDGLALYQGLAALERDPERRRVFERLAEGERRHAALWADKLGRVGLSPVDRPPSARVRTLLWLARRLGTRAVLPLVIQAESLDAAKYSRQSEDTDALVADEQEHQAALERLRGGTGPAVNARIAQRERWHRAGRGGSLRAAVFGMNDGLVSNVSLVMGVAAAGTAPGTVFLTGLAGLFAGAFSMAVGEYVSVASQRDVLRWQVKLEARELAEAPDEERAELGQLLAEKGLSPEKAAEMAAEIMKHPSSALDTLVREELGLDPEDLGSPVTAALSSFTTFASGAALPLLPFVWLHGRTAMVVSAAITAVVLGAVGAALGFLSGTSPLRSSLRMLGLAAAAASLTFGVGRIFGATMG
jgi:VIT1/CCC1 family predicted Fe2+/Mn2+ transporter